MSCNTYFFLLHILQLKFIYHSEEPLYVVGKGLGEWYTHTRRLFHVLCIYIFFLGGGGGSHLCRCSFNSTQLLFFAFSNASALTYSLRFPGQIITYRNLLYLGLAPHWLVSAVIRFHVSGATPMQAVSLFEVFFLMLIISFFLYCGLLGMYCAIVNSKWQLS